MKLRKTAVQPAGSVLDLIRSKSTLKTNQPTCCTANAFRLISYMIYVSPFEIYLEGNGFQY